MFVGTAVARYAIVKFADAFLDVLAPDVGQRVLVAAIAGVAAVVIASMASRARNVVVAIERKVLVVLEARWRPLLLRVTLQDASCEWCARRAACAVGGVRGERRAWRAACSASGVRGE